ncbi:unnamed protein product [Haemonchus placei]|uniref:Uncharacterized protein n=1 Tax=Haemonchus placei TaxID=6290 RepID=A0A0N4W2D8_HAEPC|nr:unnamed protein product [Haemonchus placei]
MASFQRTSFLVAWSGIAEKAGKVTTHDEDTDILCPLYII